MKKQWSEEAGRIEEFIGKLAEYQLAEIPQVEALQGKYQLSDLFHQKMDKMIWRQEKKAKRRGWIRGIGAAAAVLLLVFLLGNPEFVAEAANRVYQWLSDHVSFQFRENTDVNYVPRYQIGYVPEGYELVEDEYYEAAGIIECYNKNGDCISLFYGVIDSSMDVDNENKELLVLKGEGKQKVYYLKGIDNDSSITWQSEDGTTVFNLSGLLSEEELLKIYESIKVVEE